MADARALLKARRAEARIEHPLATYNASGQLRCIACQVAVKQASQWAGHVGSKGHRVNVGRMKEEERKKAEEERARGKRKAEEEDEDDQEMVEEDGNKRRRVEEAGTTNGFPADFFSDPNQGPILSNVDDEDEDEDEETNGRPPQTTNDADTTMAPPPATKPQAHPSAIDLEFEQFQREIASVTQNLSTTEEGRKDTFERATVFAEPEMASAVPEGFPPSASDPSQPTETETGPAEPTEEEKRLKEDEERRRKETDERELIMDRLVEEERLQEEADERAKVMKERVEAVKRRRAAAKGGKKE